MTERIFKNKLIAELRKNFFHVIDLSMIGTSTGCPDLHISKNNKFILAELKIIPSIESRKQIKDIFERSQFIFYSKYRTLNTNLYLFFYSHKEKMIYYVNSFDWVSVIDININTISVVDLLREKSLKGTSFYRLQDGNNLNKFCSKEIQYIFGFETRKARKARKAE